MKVLVVNCGSSSIKYKLYEFPSHNLLNKGNIERVGERSSKVKDHKSGIKILVDNLLKAKAINNLEEIAAIGHRVVHGGEYFRKPRIIDQRVIKQIKKCKHLAPLHNPVNLEGINGCKKFFPKIPQVAVFDTAFHQSIPKERYLYPIPLKYYNRYKIRKYGFHGTSHQFVASQAAKLLKKQLKSLKLITCHLGNGCSITAIDKGRSVETSMGFTPLEGLMMGTRCGDIDVAAAFYIMEKEKLSIEQMDGILNKKSGLLGISGISNDFRSIMDACGANKPKAKLAYDMFTYRVKKYIGSYNFILKGVDAVCLTGGIGENNPELFKEVKKDITSVIGKKTKVLIVPTDEEKMIADLTYKLLKSKPKVKRR